MAVRAIDDAARRRLEGWLCEAAGGAARIVALDPLAGGAIQENWALDVAVADGPWAGEHRLVLRRDAPSAVAVSHGRAEEFALLKAAHRAGVRVPTPCLLCEDDGVLGGAFFVMHRVAGEAAGYRIAKAPANDSLAAELGETLARIHGVSIDDAALSFLARPQGAPAEERVAHYRAQLDAFDHAHPALEWGLAWAGRNAPEPWGLALCHRDFRTGNYLVDGGRLVAVLDWEFAGISDPLEDIGWFCAKCWRFGSDDREAGGIGARAAFYGGYERASGRTIPGARVFYWEVMAHIRWAVIALQQAERHVGGAEHNLELALTAHVVGELEWNILKMTRLEGGSDAR